jgi:predicted dehydrogenase
MKKIRIGHMGISHDHSRAKLETVQKYPDIFEVVGIFEPNEELWNEQKDCPEYKSLARLTAEELFAIQPDAMLVEGFELDLVSYAQACVDRGIHVHIDKPAGNDIAAFERLLKDAKSKDLVVQMAYMYRYNPAVRYALEQVKQGVLGEIYQVDAIMNIEHPLGKRKWLGQFDAGIMFFLGCHMVDLIYLFQGIPNDIHPYNKSTGFDGLSVIDHGCAVFEYDNGISVARSTSTEVNGFGRRQLVICGSKGTIEIYPLETGDNRRISEITMSLARDTSAKPYSNNKRQVVEISRVSGRYDSMMLEFAACVRGECRNPFDYDHELQVQKLILAACGQDINFRPKNM